jgi:hypothetical protein
MNALFSTLRRLFPHGGPKTSAAAAQTSPGPVKKILKEISNDEQRILAVRKADQEYSEANGRNDHEKCRAINAARPGYHKPYLDRRVGMYETIVGSDSEAVRHLLSQALHDRQWFV